MNEGFQGILAKVQLIFDDDIVSRSGGSLQTLVRLKEEVPEVVRGHTTINNCSWHRIASFLIHGLVVSWIESRVVALPNDQNRALRIISMSSTWRAVLATLSQCRDLSGPRKRPLRACPFESDSRLLMGVSSFLIELCIVIGECQSSGDTYLGPFLGVTVELLESFLDGREFVIQNEVVLSLRNTIAEDNDLAWEVSVGLAPKL